jgi:hypothetical protein
MVFFPYRALRIPARRVALLLVALFCAAGASVWAMVGDINGDGKVDNADIALAENHAIGKTLLDSAGQAKGDVNGNGMVDVGDLIALAKLQGNTLCIVPQVSQETRYRAELLITQAGLTLGTVLEVRSNVYTGLVVGQRPGVGMGVAPGSSVDIFVSAGASSGAHLEIEPASVDLGTGGTQATFQVRSVGGSLPWRAGMWADFTATPPTGVGNGSVTLTLDRTRLPFGPVTLTFAVVPDIGSSEGGAYAEVRLNQTVHPPPVLDAIHGHTPFSAGDRTSIDGDLFAQNAADNLVEVNGVEVPAASVSFSPPNVVFHIPEGTSPGMVQIRVRRKADASLGPSPWSRPIAARVVTPMQIQFSAGRDGNALWFHPAWWRYGHNGETYQYFQEAAGGCDWVLGGGNFSRVNGASPNAALTPPFAGGNATDPMCIEAVVNGKAYYIPASVQSDTEVLALPHLMYENQDQFFAALTPGKAFSARIWGSEKGTFFPRASNWTTLKMVSTTPITGSLMSMSASDLRLPNTCGSEWTDDTIFQIAQGTTLLISRDVYDPMVLQCAGLWSGDLTFMRQADFSSKGHLLVRVPLNTPGLYTIRNVTNGKKRIIEVVPSGAPQKYFATQDYMRFYARIYDVIVPKTRDLDVFANGARLHIPAGALPSTSDTNNLVTFVYHVLDPSAYELSDPEAEDGKERIELYFRRASLSGEGGPIEWEPTELLKPITMKMPYIEDRALNGPPPIGAMDPDSNIYWSLPCTFDVANRIATLVFPAGTYVDAPPGSAGGGIRTENAQAAPPPGFPPVSLYKITRSMGIPYIRSSRGVMTDPNNLFSIDYITDPSSSSYASDAYASGIMDTLLAAHANLSGRNWKPTTTTTEVSLRKTVFSYYGSTDKAVFGKPAITINVSKCPSGSNAYYTTPAHEVGHVFQRRYTTNVISKWFDEASADWVALDTVKIGHFLADNLNDAMPFTITLPSGFTLGYTTAQGYAASPWPAWLESKYPNSVRKMYEALDGHPLNWEDHYGVVATACGKDVGTLYRGFARDYWLQNFDPVMQADLHTRMVETGKTVAYSMDESGDVSFSDSRPVMSSIRFSIEPTAGCVTKFTGRAAVIRFGVNSDAVLYEASVYGDRAGATFVPSNPSAITTFSSGNGSFKLSNPAAYRTYRFILANSSKLKAFAPSIRMVYPTITSLSPSNGPKAGGYTVVIYGTGFGDTAGTLNIAGSPVTTTKWTDTEVRFTMPNVGDNTTSWNITLRTAEDVQTNGKTFTFN